MINVLNFARKFKYPLQRSAFTYCDDERPSRIDFAELRYGGPFTTEHCQVEDVKTFLRMLKLLLCLGIIFIVEIPISFVAFNIFGAHIGYKADFISRCTVWAILDLESSSLRYIMVIAHIYIYKVLYGRWTSMFIRLSAGLLLYILGTVSILAIAHTRGPTLPML